MAEVDRDYMIGLAKDAAKLAYAPYSEYFVGAAGVFKNEVGELGIFTGCNVENASYGLTNCAERTAIFKAVSAGFIYLLEMYIYTPTETTGAPCGACRQVMNEFGPKALIVDACETEVKETTLDKLLPDAFGPHNLGK